MNFDYILTIELETEELQEQYRGLYRDLKKAEELYWSEPQKCGMLLRLATEKICQIYNGYYEIGFPESAVLEDFLCYTEQTEHNVMVSRFLSVVRSEQRDRLEWLRVWGDECIFMDENPKEIARNQDKLYINVRKMMTHMMDATREMCEKINHRNDLKGLAFDESILPGYQTADEREEQEREREKEAKKQRFSFFRKK